MGWILLAVAVGWTAASFYWYSQHGESSDSTSAGAFVVGALLFLLAAAIGISAGIESGDIVPNATPTLLGR